MGISGLLPMLKEVQVPMHIRECKGKTLAVDAYVWLHRGAYGCAEKLVMGEPTISYVNYAMHRVRMLKHFGVTPLIVFDGGLLPSKMGTEDAREQKRSEATAKGAELKARGKHSEAREYFVKAVDVTPEMAYQLIKALKLEKVQYVVAPYEADPQLAYLERKGLVDGIITEDSDLLVFGCRNVYFKLDGEGNCVHVARAQFAKCREYNFSGWGDKEFRQMAILSGCDYVDSIVGIGLKKAYMLMRKYQTAEKVVQFVRLSGNYNVPRDYMDNFKRAELTFCHQRVFDPVSQSLVHFEPLPPGLTASDMPFVGAELDPEYARGLAAGDIDPISKLPMVDINPTAFSSNAPYSPPPFAATKISKASVATGSAAITSFFHRVPKNPQTSCTINGTRDSVRSKAPAGVKRAPSLKDANRSSASLQSKFFGGGSSSVAKHAPVEIVEVENDEEDVYPPDVDESFEMDELDDTEDLDAYEAMAAFGMQDRDSDFGEVADDDFKSQPRPLKRDSSVVSVSSPPPTPPRPVKRQNLDVVDEVVEADQEFDGATTEVELSSPSALKAHSSLLLPAPSAARTKPIVEVVTSPVASTMAIRGPSSDPIILSSDDVDFNERKPDIKPQIARSPPKARRSLGSKLLAAVPRAKKDPKSRSLSSSSSSPKNGVADDEPSETTLSVAAQWRLKFTNPSIASKTPTGNSSTRRIPPMAPRAQSQARVVTRPASSASRKSAAMGKADLAPSAQPPRAAVPARLPLSPKNPAAVRSLSISTLQASRSPVKMRCDEGTRSSFAGPQPPNGVENSFSASPRDVVITNKKLLAFAFKSPV